MSRNVETDSGRRNLLLFLPRCLQKGVSSLGTSEATNSVSESPKPPRFTRRRFLWLTAGGVATLFLWEYLNWTTEDTSENAELKLNTRLLEGNIYPVTDQESQRAIQLLTGPVPVAIEEQIKSVQEVRNFVRFNPLDKTAEEVALLARIARQEKIRFSAGGATDNFEATVDYEAYLALRHLADLGLVDQSLLTGIDLRGMAYGVKLGSARNSQPTPVEELSFPEQKGKLNSFEQVDALVSKHWGTIKEAAKNYQVDLYYLAAIIATEARNEEQYFLYDWQPGKGIFLADMIAQKDVRGTNRLLQRLKRVIVFINENKEIARRFLPSEISEEVTDLVGAMLGQNTSVGLGQLKLDTAKLAGAIEIGGRRINERMARQIVGLLLTNSRINIYALACYARRQIEAFAKLQKEGKNLYLPNLCQYSPSTQTGQSELTNDPMFGPQWPIAFYGGCYALGEYPQRIKSKDPQTLLRIPEGISGWGNYLAAYRGYLRERFS